MSEMTLDEVWALAEQAEDALVGLLHHCTAFPGAMTGERVETALAVASAAEKRRYPNVLSFPGRSANG